MSTNLAYQDEFWDELIDGQPVMMSPRPIINHNRISFNIARIFANHLDKRKCETIADGTDLYLTEKDRFVPDVMVVCDPHKLRTRGVYGAPDLVVEVLSPSTAKRDRGYKKNAYEKAGVKEYWLVSPTDKSIEQYILTDEKFVLHEVYSLKGDYAPEEMTEEEKEEEKNTRIMEFKCSLYDDLLIKLEDVFARVK